MREMTMTTKADRHVPDGRELLEEQLSAWLDDELPGVEQELLVNRVADAPELKARVARYSLIGSSLRGELRGRAQIDVAALALSSRVQTALDDLEMESLPPASRPRPRGIRYALAAGVALAAVGIGLVQGPAQPPPGESVVARPLPAGEGQQLVGQAPAVLAAAGSQATLSPRRLTRYLVSHGKYSGVLSARVTESHIVNHSPNAVAMSAVDRLPAQ